MPLNTLTVPIEAMKHVADLRILSAKATAAGNVPVEILARSADVIDHWFYGRMIHDLDGLVDFKRTAIDYGHDDTAELGFVDEALTTDAGLVCRGYLVPFKDDPVEKILAKAAGGVPYEASISYDDLSIEELKDDVTAEVNGRTITGPCRIIRQWKLRGLAICLYGADDKTETRLTEGGQTRKVKLMSATPTPIPPAGSPPPVVDPPATDPPATDPPAADPPAADPPATDPPAADPPAANKDTAPNARALEAAPFLKEFGKTAGPTYFARGITIEAARVEHLAAVTADNEKLRTERDELTAKIEAADLGDPDPLRSDDPNDGQAGGGKLAHLPDGIRRFAEGLKIVRSSS